MHPEQMSITPNTPRPSLYRRHWRAINATTRRQCRSGGRRAGQHAFCRRMIQQVDAGAWYKQSRSARKVARKVTQEALAAIRRPDNSDVALARDSQPQSSSAVPVHQEILRGAAIGVLACLCLVWLAGGSPLSFVAAVVWGSSLGALIGMLLWIGSATAPEEPISPPAPGQGRGDKPDKPRQRR